MSSVGSKGVIIQDALGGDAATVTGSALDVNIASGAGNIDIGDVSLLLDGTAAHYGAGNVADGGRTLRVTLASDDPAVVKLGTIDTDTNNIATSVGSVAGAIGTHDNGAGSYGMHMMGQSNIVDGSQFPIVTHEGDSTKIACSMYGIQFANLVTESGTDSAVVIDDVVQVPTPGMVNVGGEYRDSNTTYSPGDATILQTDINGALKTTHNITGLGSDDNYEVGTSAEKISGVDGDVACKRVDIMAHPDNTGYIWVGDSAITVNGLNGGIRLAPGDFYSMDVDNTGDIYVISTVNEENVCFNYFT